MPLRRTLAVVAICASLIVVVLCFVAASQRPAISIAVASYQPWDNGLAARVAITNTGPITINYNHLNFDGNARVLVETRTGWTNTDIGPLAVCPASPALLEPHSNTVVIVRVPPGALRWQVGYRVRAASTRDRVIAKLPFTWRPRLYPICQRLLSDEEGPPHEFWSDIFDLWNLVEPPVPDITTTAVFDPLSYRQ